MKLPNCPHCNHKFSWGSIFKSQWRFRQSHNCPQCHTKLYPSRRTRNLISFFVLAPPLVAAFFLQASGVYYGYTILVMLILSMGIGGIIPFFYKFVDKDEPLW